MLAEQSTPGVTFAIVPPGGEGDSETIAASSLLPGWLISLSLVDAERVEQSAGRRVAIYLWAGSLGVAALAIAGLLLGQLFARQLRVSRLKTDLVAAVSHELRTPLASMRAVVDLLLDDPDMDRTRVREYLQLVAGENARLSRLIEHFLTFSRIERTGHQLAFAPVPPAAIVQAAVASGRDRFRGLQIDMAPDVPSVYGDEDALATVLLNLLENAYKYTAEPRRVSLRVFHEAGRVVFEVEDNGIGIARRDQTRVFRPFFQVDHGLTRASGGCGLGLSIVDFLVRAHGGHVSVRSEPGAGSCFRVALPARTAASEAA
jgi:signal transduction histidine kinase